jgi:hypothetical protein
LGKTLEETGIGENLLNMTPIAQDIEARTDK